MTVLYCRRRRLRSRLPPPGVFAHVVCGPPLRKRADGVRRMNAETKPVHGGASFVQGSILLVCHHLGEAPGPPAGLGSKRLSRAYGGFGSNLGVRSVKGRGWLARGGPDMALLRPERHGGMSPWASPYP